MACQQAKKIAILESSFNNEGLDQQERTAEKVEVIRLASIFGGTSTY
jgi:hypothetical protein